jgi:CRISPR type III-B/RAMP module-associated protein Cmr5
MPKTIDQICAESAYKAYTELRNSDDKDKIFGYAKKLPMMIINSGLVAAIMFKYNKDGHNEFHKYFLKWLTGIEPENEKPGDDLIKELLKDASSLRYYTSRALRWLFWFNKFADTKDVNKE